MTVEIYVELKLTKETLRSGLDLIFCVTSFLISFKCLPPRQSHILTLCLSLCLSRCLQRLGCGLNVCALKPANPLWTRLWSSWTPMSLTRGNTPAESAPSPLATLTMKCRSSYGVSRSLMALVGKDQLCQFCCCINMWLGTDIKHTVFPATTGTHATVRLSKIAKLVLQIFRYSKFYYVAY